MAAAGGLTAPRAPLVVTRLRLGLVAALMLVWEAAAASGLFYRDVVPSLVAIARALVELLTDGERSFYWHLGVTAYEVLAALAIGSVAGGMREIAPVLIRVGQSFRASTVQMVIKIYLPAMRGPVVNGLRLGLGVAIIVVLLAETKFANRGLGYLVIQSYFRFDMPQLYALLMVLFALAIGGNVLMGRLSAADPRAGP